MGEAGTVTALTFATPGTSVLRNEGEAGVLLLHHPVEKLPLSLVWVVSPDQIKTKSQ